MLIKEIYVNRDESVIFGESDLYEPFTNEVGVLFRSLQKEYGKAQKMYNDFDGTTKQVGWVFTKKGHYEDTGETYIREVWVEVHESKPDVRVKNNYYDFR